jgi:FkbM family methyltransferase
VRHPRTLLDSLRRAASRQRSIASLEELPWRSRLSLALLDLTRNVRGSKRLVDLGPVVVEFGADSFDIDWYVFRSIFLREDYRTDYRGSSVLDIGAHKGYLGAYALVQGARQVLSIEPESDNFASLARSAGSLRDDTQTWRTLHAAVSDSEGEGRLFVGDQSWNHTLVPGLVDSDTTEAVALMGVASLLERACATDASRVVVKIDAEGAETPIVLGADAEAWSVVDQVFVEVHDDTGADWEAALEHLRSAGLQPEQLKDDLVLFTKSRP